jgi:hypothetical protein
MAESPFKEAGKQFFFEKKVARNFCFPTRVATGAITRDKSFLLFSKRKC